MRALGPVLLLLSLASCVGPEASKAPAKSLPAALPPLDHAPLLQAKQATYLTSGEPVLGIEIGGDARAYPLRILDRHAVANDTVGRVPVALAWCPACGSAVAYRTSTPRGPLTLAVSGQLLRDSQTGTLWQPLTGKAVEGPLARSGVQLEPLPVVLTTWRKWLQLHPRTRVLSLETGTGREVPPEGEASVPETSWIYGLVLDGTAKAYPVDRLKQEGVVNDELAGRPVLVVWEPGADAKDRTVRAYERGDRVFGPNERAIFGAIFLVDQEGRPWRLGEEALTTADGKRLARLPGRLTSRAAWFSAYPRTLILGDNPPAAGPDPYSPGAAGYESGQDSCTWLLTRQPPLRGGGSGCRRNRRTSGMFSARRSPTGASTGPRPTALPWLICLCSPWRRC